MLQRRQRYSLLVAVMLVFTLVLAGCGAGGGGGGAADDEIILGMVVATTGAYAGGEAPLINGARLAVEHINAEGGINGRQVRLVIEDTGSEQTGAVNAYSRIASQNPIAILSSTVSAFVLAQMEQIQNAGIPTFTGGGAVALTEQNNPWLFRVRTSDAWVPVAAATFAVEELGAEKIGVLRVNDQMGEGWEQKIIETLAEHGLEPVGVEVHGADDKDMMPQLLRLQNAGAEAVIVASHPPTHVVIMKQRKQMDNPFDLIVSNSAMLPTTLELLEADELEGVYGTVDAVPVSDPFSSDWAAEYEERFGMAADFSAAEYYDAAIMVAEAARETDGSHQAIADYLHGIAGRKGMGNTWTFGDNGDGGSQVVIVRPSPEGLDALSTIVIDR